MITEIILLILGAFTTFVIDILWWNIDFKKAEKGLEVHEHYHVGIELLILGALLSHLTDHIEYFPIGMGFAFIMAEWKQTTEIRKTENGKTIRKEVVPGHPFAYGSEHFRKSTIVGMVLTGILVFLLIIDKNLS